MINLGLIKIGCALIMCICAFKILDKIEIKEKTQSATTTPTPVAAE